MKTVGFVGIGIMGGAMVQNLLRAGYAVQVYTRTREKAQAVLDAGAVWRDTPAACAQGAEAVFSIVGYPSDVESVYFGPEGILAGAAPGTCVVDMTTSSPALARRIYEAAQARGLSALDAPVTGGDTGARNGTLTILVGGDEAAFAACRPAFEAMGRTILHMGGPGMGQHTKLANQIAIAGTLSGCVEALVYAERVGLDPVTVQQALAGGAAGSFQMSNVAARMLKGDLAPGFFIKHFVKDMDLASAAAQEASLDLPTLDQVRGVYHDLMDAGHGDLGTQGLVLAYEEK